MESSDALLAAGGPIDSQWPGFIAREGQQQMAARVQPAIDDQISLLVEAPSGSGKTLAYLVPIVTGEKRAIVSTASRYLQNQLFKYDLPLLQKLLGSSKTVALLQGRRHSLCTYYLKENTRRTREARETGKSDETYRQLIHLPQPFQQNDKGIALKPN